jgi:hypothetical protein
MALWSNTDAEASKPKYLNAADKAATLGVDVAEAQLKANKDKGVQHPGWVKTTTYTDAQGNTRNKTETLVAMSSITGDNDTIDPDPVITIGTQPANLTVVDGEPAQFTVAATATRGATLSYLWQVSTDGTTWTNLPAATSATLAFPEVVLADDGNQYRVIVSATGATSVTSSVATLTVTEE